MKISKVWKKRPKNQEERKHQAREVIKLAEAASTNKSTNKEGGGAELVIHVKNESAACKTMIRLLKLAKKRNRLIFVGSVIQIPDLREIQYGGDVRIKIVRDDLSTIVNM